MWIQIVVEPIAERLAPWSALVMLLSAAAAVGAQEPVIIDQTSGYIAASGGLVSGQATVEIDLFYAGGGFTISGIGYTKDCQVPITHRVSGDETIRVSERCGDYRVDGWVRLDWSEANGRVSANLTIGGAATTSHILKPNLRVEESTFYLSAPDPRPRVNSSAPGMRGPFEIVASHSGRCLAVPAASQDPGVQLVQWDCIGVPDQKWYLRPTADGRYEVVASHSGKCLDVSGVSGANGAAVIQWDCNGQDNQRWTFVPMAGGYELVAAHSGKCLDVARVAREAGTEFHQWECLGPSQTNQVFTIR